MDADDDDRPRHDHPSTATSGADPTTADPTRRRPVPRTAPAPEVDRTALLRAGGDVARAVRALLAGAPVELDGLDEVVLAVAATGALAARLPALSGADGAVAFDGQEDELLHAYADLLVTRAEARRPVASVGRDDVLAVAHVAAAAAASHAAADPALLLLAEVPAARQLRAAVLLLTQTAADDGGAPDRLPAEVQQLFSAAG